MKRAKTQLAGIVFTVLAIAVLAGPAAAFAISSEQSLNRALEEKARAERSLAAIETRLAQNAPEPEPSDEPSEPEPSDEPFAPEHPYYEDLYPDFYAPQELTASNAPAGVIYLTFDDGPSARTDEILAVLARENIKATFFVVGQTSEVNLQRMRDIVDQGHTIAMHSYSHNYAKIYASVEAFVDDMYQIFDQIRETAGVPPTFFRFPGGSVNSYDYGIYEDIMAEMLRRGFIPCDWNMSAQDATAKPLPVNDIIANVLSTSNRSRGVVLMHDSAARTTTAEALPELIRQLRELGFQFEKLTPDVKPIVFGYRSFS